MTSILSLITPTNLPEERERFFASSSYDPVFRYRWQEENSDPTFEVVAKYALWDAVKAQDHRAIVEAARNLFEVEIEEDMVERANSVTKTEGKISVGSLEEIVWLCKQAIKQFNLGYEVKVVEQEGFNIRPQHAERTLLISHHVHFEYFSMEASVNHELVHMLRYVNGKHNKIKLTQRYLPTEEGLASYYQDRTNDDLSQVQHAMEYIASAVGLGGSLRDIFECLCAMGMSPELAWKRASRHKFGFVETKRPGDILKPAMYYANAEKIAELTSDERLRLFIGKIHLSELPNYPEYQGIWEKEELMSYFKV